MHRQSIPSRGTCMCLLQRNWLKITNTMMLSGSPSTTFADNCPAWATSHRSNVPISVKNVFFVSVLFHFPFFFFLLSARTLSFLLLQLQEGNPRRARTHSSSVGFSRQSTTEEYIPLGLRVVREDSRASRKRYSQKFFPEIKVSSFYFYRRSQKSGCADSHQHVRCI